MIEIENVSKRYGGGSAPAVAPTTLTFADAATSVLLGPSGCGKSTLLRIILGLITPTTGWVAIDGEAVAPTTAERLRHKIGYVVQDGGLFPHMTASQNVTLLARYLKRPTAEIERRLGELSELAHLPRPMLDRYPAEMSGGQRQRVGLMRALMLDPPTLLLDEPLGALDPITRLELQEQLRDIFRRLRKTVVLVTHDLGEAAYLGDAVALMRDGEVVQFGAMTELVNRPAQPYVAEFLRAQRAAAYTGAAEQQEPSAV